MLAQGYQGRCNHGRHPPLSGVDSNGQFRTAVAKIYPPKLNWALALGIRQFVNSRCTDCADDVPGEFLPLQSFELVEDGRVQPDYHG